MLTSGRSNREPHRATLRLGSGEAGGLFGLWGSGWAQESRMQTYNHVIVARVGDNLRACRLRARVSDASSMEPLQVGTSVCGLEGEDAEYAPYLLVMEGPTIRLTRRGGRFTVCRSQDRGQWWCAEQPRSGQHLSLGCRYGETGAPPCCQPGKKIKVSKVSPSFQPLTTVRKPHINRARPPTSPCVTASPLLALCRDHSSHGSFNGRVATPTLPSLNCRISESPTTPRTSGH